MKDFTPTQKLLMAVAMLAAVTFAVAMAFTGDAGTATAVTQPVGFMTPF